MNDIKGVGEMVSRAVQVKDFTAVDVGGSYLVNWKYSDIIALTVEMQENLFEYLEVSVKREKLCIGSSKSFKTSGADNRPRVYIESPYLKAINLSGAASTGEWDKIKAENLSLILSGAANANISLEVGRLEIFASGACNIELAGNAGACEISASGACNVKAGEFQVREAKINVSGASNVNIACSDNLDAGVSGASNVRYTGSPAVKQRVSGAGSVKHG